MDQAELGRARLQPGRSLDNLGSRGQSNASQIYLGSPEAGPRGIVRVLRGLPGLELQAPPRPSFSASTAMGGGRHQLFAAPVLSSPTSQKPASDAGCGRSTSLISLGSDLHRSRAICTGRVVRSRLQTRKKSSFRFVWSVGIVLFLRRL
jgi:hypothetical protein